jgi:hypothetical protein
MFRRRPRLPAARRPPLERDERVLAWAALPEGGALVATNRGLWAPAEPAGSAGPGSAGAAGPDGPGGSDGPGAAGSAGAGEPRRWRWHELHRAAWDGRELTVTPAVTVERREGYALVADLPTRSYRPADPGDVPHQVRARVTASVAYSRHHPAPGGGGVRVVARRVSGVDGVTWTVRADPGTDVESPAARAAIGQLVAQGRGELPGPADGVVPAG